jgi:hypothetical protein
MRRFDVGAGSFSFTEAPKGSPISAIALVALLTRALIFSAPENWSSASRNTR